ncbi:hypothetical protein PRK78_004887 [Emydomyces testavorans]|uniref:Protein kinase domain-containing protein n=1 Tax=Emydomyces testavorans TaxID=2070801 RepID=A0AAF0DIQ6_9EURO|nr:hypothetical protein PRK78_004887 [Emydomyces testavorans]
MELLNVKPNEITFRHKLFESKYSEIHLVEIRGLTCIMKVHHGRGPRKPYEHPTRELDIHVRERTAYERLKEHGLCDRGIIPYFYGSMSKFDPKLCEPYLKAFWDDEYPPSAIFLEYIPNIERLTFENFNDKRADNWVKGLREINKALVNHHDAVPRNMMVVKDDPERVVWLDFDRAWTFNPKKITAQEKTWLAEEDEGLVYMMETMLSTGLPVKEA